MFTESTFVIQSHWTIHPHGPRVKDLVLCYSCIGCKHWGRPRKGCTRLPYTIFATSSGSIIISKWNVLKDVSQKPKKPKLKFRSFVAPAEDAEPLWSMLQEVCWSGHASVVPAGWFNGTNLSVNHGPQAGFILNKWQHRNPVPLGHTLAPCSHWHREGHFPKATQMSPAVPPRKVEGSWWQRRLYIGFSP